MLNKYNKKRRDKGYIINALIHNKNKYGDIE